MTASDHVLMSEDIAALVKTLVGLARSNPIGSDDTAAKAEQDAHIDVLIGISSLQRTITTLESEIATLRKAAATRAVSPELRALSERASPLRVFSELDDRGRLFVIRGTAPHYTGNGEIIARNLTSENAKFFAAAVNYVRDRIAFDRAGGE